MKKVNKINLPNMDEVNRLLDGEMKKIKGGYVDPNNCSTCQSGCSSSCSSSCKPGNS